MDWWGATVSTATVGSGVLSAAWFMLPDFVAENYVDPTIIRTRFSIAAAAQGNGRVHAAAGVIAWDSKDNTVPSLPPSPVTDTDLDWIVVVPILFAEGTVGNRLAQLSMPEPADSKAMRRLGAQKGLLFVIHNSSVSLPSLEYTVFCRGIIKE